MVAVIVIVATFAVLGGMMWVMVSRRRGEAWEGEVTDKTTRTVSDSEGNDSTAYYLVVKRTDGQTKKVSVSKKLFEQFAVGDKVVKNPGQYNPVKA